MDRKYLKFFPEHYAYERIGKHLHVEPYGVVLEVIEVELKSAQHFLDGVGVAIIECGIRRHPRTYAVEKLVARVALHNLVDVELALGPIADESHVATHHIPQLWQFIKMVHTQKAAHARESWVVHGAVEQ